MTDPQDRPVAISLRLYRTLASAFPQEFKNAYGEELVQVAEDAIEPIWRRHGVLGLVRLLVDIAIRVPAEHLAEMRQDIRYGLRTLAGSPGFTAVALISLSLGIGVATSAFSEMNGFVLRDVPGVRKPGELVTLAGTASYPDYQRYRRLDLFSSMLAYVAPVPFGVALGRVFDERDQRPGDAPSVVVSYRFWKNRLGSDAAAIGKALLVNGQPCTIIGVGPPKFQGASPMIYGADLWLPVSVGGRVAPELADGALERHDLPIFHVVGRLKPGVSPAGAEAALDAVARQLEQEHGDRDRNQQGRRVMLLPGGKLLPVHKRDLPLLTGFMTLLGGMILLIASSNVANMLLARAADRRKEIAVRLALGAGRARLIRQLLTESMLLAAGAGVLGFLMASVLMHFASREKLPYPMPLSFHLEPDGRVLLFTIALTGFTGLAFGLLPALQATRTDLTPALKEGGNVRLRRFRRLSLRNLLVLSQVAGSLALLLMTGFLVIGHRRIAGPEVGFEARHLYLISLDPIRDGYSGEEAATFFRTLLDRIKLLPSITGASLADSAPMSMIGKPGTMFAIAGTDDSREIHWARKYVVGSDYFDTIGIPILRGRGFRKQDEADSPMAVIVSEKLVRDCWKGRDPLGRRIEIGNEDVPSFELAGNRTSAALRRPMLGRTRTYEVVGVAKNMRDGLDLVPADAPAVMYLPLRPAEYARSSLHGVTLIVRAAPGVDAVGAVRREISAIDDHVTPFNARGMPEQIEELMFPVKVALWTYGFIGIFGLILASVGLAGVTAYSVAQRRREIGIRVALGAGKRDVLGLVMKEGAALVAVGMIIGLGAALAGIRFLSAIMAVISRTAGRSSSDPLLLAGAPLLLAAVALAACYLAARKSLRIAPAVALRQE